MRTLLIDAKLRVTPEEAFELISAVDYDIAKDLRAAYPEDDELITTAKLLLRVAHDIFVKQGNIKENGD